jgi:acyl-coenzyme A synthetase/AMP-(fatty) acid ligase/3-hydroxymyristoyl/3-hydroxydecanoyl-(acyl carrier protein) dehydratase
VGKRLSNLQEEARRLEELWGSRVGTAVVFGTASHQHLYGMLFRVLWPIAHGRAFQSDLVLHASELIPRMRARGNCILASVPSHLKRMVRQRGVRELADFCTTTFSSGGLLHTETATAWKQALGEAPLEVFGSTETGGIAWRAQNQLPRDLGWTPFPGVQIGPENDENGVRVRSPFVSTTDPAEGITIGDRISWLEDGRFRLLGRADRVVKVGEKRLDLSQMESALRSHPFVEDVALLLVDQEGEARVAGVVAPSEEGRAALASDGRIAYGRSLSESLAPHWDRVSLPRLWRTVDALPENAQGKITFDALRKLFDAPPPFATQRFDEQGPKLHEQHRSENSVLQSCSVPEDLDCFRGHFPGFPVVPGIVQLRWAMNVARALLGREAGLRELEALKFGTSLAPGERFELRVERTDRCNLSFRLWSGDREFASGRMRVASEAAA